MQIYQLSHIQSDRALLVLPKIRGSALVKPDLALPAPPGDFRLAINPTSKISNSITYQLPPLHALLLLGQDEYPSE